MAVSSVMAARAAAFRFPSAVRRLSASAPLFVSLSLSLSLCVKIFLRPFVTVFSLLFSYALSLFLSFNAFVARASRT
jgi:hypothetical protein